VNSSGSVYTNVDYAQDLRNIGIDTDDVWQRKLVSLGYDISFDKDGNLMASKNQVTDITGTLESTNVEWHNALTGQEIEYDSEKQSYYIKPYYLLEGVFGKKIYLKAEKVDT